MHTQTITRPADATADERAALLADLGPTCDLRTAAKILGIGQTLAYQSARKGEFPTRVLRVGGRWVVPTAPLRRLLAETEAGQ